MNRSFSQIYFSEVCSLFPLKRAQSIHGLRSNTNPSVQSVRYVPGLYHRTAIYPTPPPFSSHAFEKNDVTSIMTRNACQNKQLASPSPSGIHHFLPGLQQSLNADEARSGKTAIVFNHSSQYLSSSCVRGPSVPSPSVPSPSVPSP
jgi:hypothetical protein